MLTKHKMDSEQMFVEAEACRIVNEAKDRGNKVCAVGTDVMRAIETAVGTDGHLKEFEVGQTSLFSLRTISHWLMRWSATSICRCLQC